MKLGDILDKPPPDYRNRIVNLMTDRRERDPSGIEIQNN